MSHFRVSSFEGREDLLAESGAGLDAALRGLSARFSNDPLLVNVYDGDDRILIVGVGAPLSTLQCVDKQRGVSLRAISDFSDGEDKEFNYQGEATFVPSEYLVDAAAAIRGAVAWITKGDLISELNWRSRPYPTLAS